MGFGYTLFGEKPIVFELLSNCPTDFVLKEGWRCWEKYRHLFPSSYFSLECMEDCFSEKQQLIALFNLKILKNIDNDTKKLFSQVNDSETIEKIHQLIKNPTNRPKEHFLLGVLLGFGEKNAARFARYNEIFNALVELPYFPNNIPEEFNQLNEVTKERIFYQKPRVTPDHAKRTQESFVQIVKENNNVTKDWESLSQIYPDGPMTFIKLPIFIADRTLSETKELHQNFNKVRTKITSVLQEPNFLELVLTRYCEGF